MLTSVRPRAAAQIGPWFRRYPSAALTLACLLYAAILGLRLLYGGPTDAYSMLYALPVALIAITFGLRSGAAAGVIAVVLMVVWAVLRDVSLPYSAWASRVLPMLLLGVLLGDASDQLRRAEAKRHSLEGAALMHREAIEVNDSLVQGIVAARWSLEAGRTADGLRLLDDTIARAHDLVSDLIRRADMAERTEPIIDHRPHPESRP